MAIVDIDWKKRNAESWKKQKLDNLPVDGSRYNSLEFMNKEWKYMWPKVWLLLGREEEVPNPGEK